MFFKDNMEYRKSICPGCMFKKELSVRVQPPSPNDTEYRFYFLEVHFPLWNIVFCGCYEIELILKWML